MKIKITAESSCDLSKEQVERFGIKIFPMAVTLGEDVYQDGVDLTPDGIFEYVAATKVLPKTNAIAPVQFEDYFNEQLQDADAVIHFSISSGISSCYQNACLAAEEVENVYVVDTKSLSTGMSLLVLKAAELAAEENADAKTIAETCRALVEKLNVSFVLGDLEYMRKGGRCSAVEMFGANLLKLRPVLQMDDGKLGVHNKLRGPLPKVLELYIDERLNNAEPRTDRVFFTHTCTDDTIPNLAKKYLEDKGIFKEILLSRAGATVTSHCGKDTFGILFLNA
ncbi:MAG: DegV family protein [Clostridia bacterium]|nr:DegV family protein [Clostridia bacterium]